MKKILIIEYTNKIENTLDKEIRQVMEKNGWNFVGSGFCFPTKTRDIEFMKNEISYYCDKCGCENQEKLTKESGGLRISRTNCPHCKSRVQLKCNQ